MLFLVFVVIIDRVISSVSSRVIIMFKVDMICCMEKYL